jgi:hypothetical protein
MMNALSLANEGLRKSQLTCEKNASISQGIKQGEISRVNQYLAEVMGRFQELKNIADYRTPLGLRTFCELFIVILPVIFGPHYAHYAKTSQVMGYVCSSALIFRLRLTHSLPHRPPHESTRQVRAGCAI